MTTKIDNTKWDCPDNTIVDIKENKIVFKNNTSDKITIKYDTTGFRLNNIYIVFLKVIFI